MNNRHEDYVKKMMKINKSWEDDISKPMYEQKQRIWDPVSLVWLGGKGRKT